MLLCAAASVLLVSTVSAREDDNQGRLLDYGCAWGKGGFVSAGCGIQAASPAVEVLLSTASAGVVRLSAKLVDSDSRAHLPACLLRVRLNPVQAWQRWGPSRRAQAPEPAAGRPDADHRVRAAFEAPRRVRVCGTVHAGEHEWRRS